MTNLVILDRDGVINEDSAAFIKTPDEWQPIPGSLEAIARLTREGVRTVVATNQSGIKRRLLDVEALNLIHARMHKELAVLGGSIEAVFFCPCLPRDHCDCYKPNPGMLLEIGERLNIDLGTVPVIGDSLRDIQAAANAGALPILVRTGNGEKTLLDPDFPAGTPVYADLAEAIDEVVFAQ